MRSFHLRLSSYEIPYNNVKILPWADETYLRIWEVNPETDRNNENESRNDRDQRTYFITCIVIEKCHQMATQSQQYEVKSWRN